MSENKTTVVSSGGGLGFGSLLTLIFITLKLTGFIAWSWLWVLSPLWIPLAAVGGLLVGAGIVGLIASVFSE